MGLTMSLGDDVRQMVPEFRSAAVSLLADFGRIDRPGAGGTIDPVTGVFTPAADSLVYEGPCRVRMQARSSEEADVFGDTSVTTTRVLISFPYDIPDVEIDDVVIITESDDPHIGGRSFRVVAVPSSTFLMYREVGAEVVEA